MREYKSLCRICGEEFLEDANYRIKLLPAKRVPKKAKQIAEALKGKPWRDLSKFQKYMLKKSTPTNIMEVTCGNCSGISNIRMKKPIKILESKNVPVTPISFSVIPEGETKSSMRKKRKIKTPKDLTAGLIIPAEILNSKSPAPWLANSDRKSDSQHFPKRQLLDQETFETASASSSADQIKKKSSSDAKNSKSGIGNTGTGSKKMQAKAKANEQQRMSKLKKVLFQSKQSTQAAASASRSFLNFLKN